MHPVTRTPKQPSCLKRTLAASPRDLDAKLELLQQLGYEDRFYLDDDASIPDEKPHYLDRDTDRWIQTEYNWALGEAAESAASIPDLFDGGLSVCLRARPSAHDMIDHTRRSRRRRGIVSAICVRPNALRCQAVPPVNSAVPFPEPVTGKCRQGVYLSPDMMGTSIPPVYPRPSLRSYRTVAAVRFVVGISPVLCASEPSRTRTTAERQCCRMLSSPALFKV